MISEKISESATPLIIEIAKSFITLIRDIEPKWEKAYLRYVSYGSNAEAKASYVHPSGIEIVNVLKNKGFFHPFTEKAQELLKAMGKEQGLFLLVTDSKFDYEFKFEYENLGRWRISKLDGGTGIPEGIDS